MCRAGERPWNRHPKACASWYWSPLQLRSANPVRSRRLPFGRPGGHDLSVGQGDGQCAIRCECEEPAVVVDGLVVQLAQRQQVVEVCQPAVSPPDDVMELGLGEADTTPRDRTRRVQAT